MIDRFIHLLYVVTGLTVLLGGIAVMNLLIGSVMERRRELALLRVAGATGPQIIGLVLVDGLIVAMVGAALGVGLGLPCASHMSGILGCIRMDPCLRSGSVSAGLAGSFGRGRISSCRDLSSADSQTDAIDRGVCSRVGGS